jgi:repressor LexA
MAEALTGIERRIYNYLVDFLKRETYQPSIREIGARFGIRSTKTVTEHLGSLQRKGYLDRAPSRSRALKIIGLDLSPETYSLPVYTNGARIGEGDPEGRLSLDSSLACSPDCFFVRAAHGVEDADVCAGDLVLVQPCEDAAERDLAVYEREGAVELQRVPAGDSSAGRNGGAAQRFIGVARAVLRTFARP